MPRIRKFFWLCSGANIQLLEKCPTDANKHAGIGATIFFTGLLAAISAGYAFYTVFNHVIAAISLGLVWGLMIFNLDRFIVSSIRKTKPLKEMVQATPRIILAILIAIVVAKPLELKIFEKEINGEITAMQQELETELETNIKNKDIEKRARLNTEIANLKSEVVAKTQKRDELRKIAQQEADGTGGTQKRNPGPIYAIKKADADRLDQELSDLMQKNNALIEQKYTEIQQLDANINVALNDLDIQDIGGPAARMEALARLSAESEAIWWANVFIIILFIVLETSPIIVKLMSEKGPYDHLLNTAEYQFNMNVYKDKGFIHDEIKKESESLQNKEKGYVNENLDFNLDNA